MPPNAQPSPAEVFETFIAGLEPDLRDAVSTHTAGLRSALQKERESARSANRLLREGILLTEVDAGELVTTQDASLVDAPTEYLLKVIKPGWGSSGYYAKEMLRRDGPTVFPRGTHMYVNHPTITEESERPERDLRDLGAVLLEGANWSDGPAGPGLYAKAKVFEAFRPFLKEASKFIGVSIHALGRGQAGEAEGREGLIIEKLLPSPFNSVDFVTKPGAGGQIVSALESASPIHMLLDEVELTAEERANTAQYLSAKLHVGMTQWVDEMFAGATITDEERKVLMEAIEASMDAFHNTVNKKAPDLFLRMPWSEPETAVAQETESISVLSTEDRAPTETPVAETVEESDEVAQMRMTLARYQMRDAVTEGLQTLSPSLTHLEPTIRSWAEGVIAESTNVEDFQVKFDARLKTVVEAVVAASQVNITGMGETNSAAIQEAKERLEHANERLIESFKTIGLSANAAVRAAKGRN